MLLDNKSAVIYGGGGSIGGAVARAFAREGVRVFLAGRTLATVEEVAEAIRAKAGAAETAEVDALDEQAVDRNADGSRRRDRHLLQPDHAPAHPRDSARRNVGPMTSWRP